MIYDEVFEVIGQTDQPNVETPFAEGKRNEELQEGFAIHVRE